MSRARLHYGQPKTRKDMRYNHFRTTKQGYEQVKNRHEGNEYSIYVHRLLATLLVDDVKELDGMYVHHKKSIPWLNTLDEIEVMTPSEHSKIHLSYDGIQKGKPWTDKRKMVDVFSKNIRSDVEIAEMFGCSAKTINNWTKRHGLSNIRYPWRNEKILRYMYHEKMMSQTQIADALETHQSTVNKWMQKHDIDTRPAHGYNKGEGWNYEY